MSGQPKVLKYFRGNAVVGRHPKVFWRNDESFVEIVDEIKFRLSGALALAAKLRVGEWPAYAWMQNTHRVYVNGSVSIKSAGSLIPSQCAYLDWNPNGRHGMMQNTESEMEAFLFAGAETTPPGKTYWTWSGGQAHTMLRFGR